MLSRALVVALALATAPALLQTARAQSGTRAGVQTGSPGAAGAALGQAGAQVAPGALSQTGARILDANRPDTGPATAPPRAAVPGQQPPPGSGVPNIRFTLREVRVRGATLVPADALAATWAGRRGQTVGVSDLSAIGDAIGALYKARGYALYGVAIPNQSFAEGVVVIQVVEGTITDVRIEGETEGADLSLLRATVDRMLEERPLRQATLERYILLMNDIPGLTVGSAFEPVEGAPPGSNRLRLGVTRKPFEFGSGVNNLGAVPLGRVQFDVNAVANSLFRQGDRTQVIWGFPGDFQRYQFFGANHTTPIGTDGMTLRLSAGYLTTRRSDTTLDGSAVTFGLLLSYPVIRAVDENLSVSAGLDTLDSNSAFLGFTASDERTRVLRAGLSYAVRDSWDGTSAANVTISGGLDALGARQRSFTGGDPAFVKANIRVGREQPLPLDFVLRLTASVQLTNENLPPSEKFLYGGPDFGRAFGAATMYGDRGVAGGLELAYKLPAAVTFGVLDGSEVYGFVDGARVYNAEPTFGILPRDRAASGGFGFRARVANTVQFQIEGAAALQRPRSAVIGRDEGWRLVFSVRSLL